MQPRVAAIIASVLLLLLPVVATTAVAEFGPVSHDGYPINVAGQALRPDATGALDGIAEPPYNKVGDVTAYPYYPLLTAEVNRLADEYPGLVKLTSTGKTVAGLDLWLLEIANFDDSDMIPLGDREVVYIDGGTHSNEYSGVYFVTEIAQFLIEEYATNETAKFIVDNRHTFILPMVNADGSHAFGRLNANTVNINRNFPGSWGAVNENPVLNNPGPVAGSEPETQSIMSLMDRIQPDYVNSIHCCGNLWLHPWGAEQIPLAEDTQMFTRVCDEVFADVRKDCGPIWSTIYPASGTTADEGYARVGAASWTYEMSGRGRIAGPWAEPLTRENVRYQERESWAGIMHAFLNVDKYGAKPVIVALEGTVDQIVVRVENQGWGNLTGGNLTIAGVAQPLPFLAPGETTDLTFAGGSFAAGDLGVTVDWKKRLHPMSPWEVRTTVLEIVEEGGRLMAVIDGGSDVVPLGGDMVDANAIPAAGAFGALAALAVAGVSMVLRRRV